MAGGFTAIIGIIIVVSYFSIKKNSSKQKYESQLEDLLADDNDLSTPPPTIVDKWNHYWSDIAKESGLPRYNKQDNTAGRDIVFLALISSAILSVLFKNIIAGVLISGALVFVASAIMKQLSTRKADSINAQLPGFLFALQANIQANETPEKAILKVIDGMPSPLYEDIVLVKHKLLAKSSFKEALEELQYKTSSRDLRFLCACMIQASAAGANLEAQITKIQEVLEARREVSDTLSKAVKSVQPSIWIASIVIPGTFMATYFMDPNAIDFWFIHPLSWAGLAGIGILWGTGVWGSKKLVDSIKNI